MRKDRRKSSSGTSLVNTKRDYLIYLFTAGWISLLLFLLLAPSGDIPFIGYFDFNGFDKIVHFVLFSVFAFAFMASRFVKDFKRRLAVTLLSGIFLGALTELLQRNIPGRSMSFSDFMIDIIGLAVAVSVCILLYETRFGSNLYVSKNS